MPRGTYTQQARHHMRRTWIATLLTQPDLDTQQRLRVQDDAQSTLPRLEECLQPDPFDSAVGPGIARALDAIAQQANHYCDYRALLAYVAALRKRVEERRQEYRRTAQRQDERTNPIIRLLRRISRRNDEDEEAQREEREGERAHARHMVERLEWIEAALSELRGAVERRVQELAQLQAEADEASPSAGAAAEQASFELATDITTWLPNREAVIAQALDGYLPSTVREEIATEVFGVKVRHPSDGGTPTLDLRPLDRQAIEDRVARALDGHGARSPLLDLLERQPSDARDTIIRRTFQRCQPFWRVRCERGLDPAALQTFRLVGVHSSDRWKQLLRDVPSHDMVEITDPYTLYASVAVHGLAAEYIASCDVMYQHYNTFHAQRGMPVHIFPRDRVDEMPMLGG